MADPPALSPAARHVQEALRLLGRDYVVRELPQSTRSAAEAAQAVGCQVGQIAKSLVFRARLSDRAVLVIASGANRVDEARLAELLGEAVGRADPDFVRRHTGYAIGGVAPVGHATALPVFIDADLLGYEQIWAAAGTPHAVFPLPARDLPALTGGQVVAIRSA